MMLMINTAGNRAGSSMVVDQHKYTGKRVNTTIRVETDTLWEIMQEFHVKSVSVLKIDIEGFEHEVLRTFFEQAPMKHWPKSVILEENSGAPEMFGSSAIELLVANGYALVDHLSPDYYFKIRPKR